MLFKKGTRFQLAINSDHITQVYLIYKPKDSGHIPSGNDSWKKFSGDIVKWRCNVKWGGGSIIGINGNEGVSLGSYNACMYTVQMPEDNEDEFIQYQSPVFEEDFQ